MFLALAVIWGILEARSSGQGPVVDAAMTDGTALLMSMIYGMKSAGRWKNACRSKDGWIPKWAG